MAYTFYLDGTKVPVTPESLNIKIKNKNKTITLINEGEVTMLKAPGLSEVSFPLLIPQQNYHFAEDLEGAAYYLELLERLKCEKKPFQFIVYREEGGRVLFKTNMTVSLEDYEITEDAENGTDLEIQVNLKQWRDYGTKEIAVKSDGKSKVTKKTSSSDGKKVTSSTYTVKKGDCLWNIARKFYGDGSKWKKIYDANKSAIEKDAKKHGYKSSSNGHWIWAGLKLTIPK